MIASIIECLKIIALAVLAAVVYGILHDQITARVCVEYFTIAHPPVFNTESPTLLALGWGTIATWWVGLVLGIPAAMLAQFGRAPKIRAVQLVRPIGLLLATMGCLALLAGVVALLLAKSGSVSLFEPMASRIPPAKHVAFLAVAAAHLASYGIGFLGGVILCLWIWWHRKLLKTTAQTQAKTADFRQ